MVLTLARFSVFETMLLIIWIPRTAVDGLITFFSRLTQRSYVSLGDKVEVKGPFVVSDDMKEIAEELKRLAETSDVILTTGGTGFAPRDVTPEATSSVVEKRCTGMEIALHTKSLQITPMAALSRAVAGIYHRTLIVNCPGSPKACKDYWGVLSPILPHATDLLKDTDDGVLHQNMQNK